MNPRGLASLIGLAATISVAREYPDYESFRDWLLREEVVGTSSPDQLEERLGADLITPVSDTFSLAWFGAVSGMGPNCGEIFLLLRSKDGLDTWPLGTCWLREWVEKDSSRHATFRLKQASTGASTGTGDVIYFETLKLEDISSKTGDRYFTRVLNTFSLLPWGISKVLPEQIVGKGFLEGSRITNSCSLTYEFLDSALAIRPSSNPNCNALNKAAKPYPLVPSTESIPRLDSLSAHVSSCFKTQGAEKAARLIDANLAIGNWKIHPRHAGCINDFGFYYEQAGKLDKAIHLLAQVTTQFPDRTPAYLNLADAYQKTGDAAKAKANYQKYVDLMEKSGKGAKVPARVRAALKP